MTDVAPVDKARLRTFSYVGAEKAVIYRAIMGAFMAAKQRFELHMRPEEVHAAVSSSANELRLEEIDAALKQLREWGNLRADPDTADVQTVEEFYRERLLYQLTAAGEAAERALALYEHSIQRPGELQTTALDDIRSLLHEFEGLLAGALDGGKIFRTLSQLCDRFEELTDRAQVFMRSLRRAIDLHGEEEEVLLAYKERLVDYLERFLRRLLVVSEDIADAIVRIERPQRGGLIDAALDAAAQREIADRLGTEAHVLAQARQHWQQRWEGLRGWFIGADGRRSQAEELRARARAAIPALLQAIAAQHERRVNRTDRYHDFRTLARWFAQASSDAEAHQLWRAAFGLVSARHLRINSETLDEWENQRVTGSTSWQQAPRLRVAPRLRATGSYNRPGKPRNVVDRSGARAQLALLAAQESQQIRQARASIASGQRVRLSAFGALEPRSFQLFLELLGDAIAQKTSADQTVSTYSADGSIHIVLEPTMDDRVACIETAAGVLKGPDHWLTLTELHVTAGDAVGAGT